MDVITSINGRGSALIDAVYPVKYAHSSCFVVLCCSVWCCSFLPTSFRVLCNIGYPSETHHQLKYRKISLVYNNRFNLIFCTEKGSDTAVLCARFQKDWSTETWVMGKRDIARFGCKMRFGRKSHIAQGPKLLPLRWRHNGRDSVSNHQPHDCLLNRLFRRRSKKTSKLRVTGL